jgi:hypothetical protein
MGYIMEDFCESAFLHTFNKLLELLRLSQPLVQRFQPRLATRWASCLFTTSLVATVRQGALEHRSFKSSFVRPQGHKSLYYMQRRLANWDIYSVRYLNFRFKCRMHTCRKSYLRSYLASLLSLAYAM